MRLSHRRNIEKEGVGGEVCVPCVCVCVRGEAGCKQATNRRQGPQWRPKYLCSVLARMSTAPPYTPLIPSPTNALPRRPDSQPRIHHHRLILSHYYIAWMLENSIVRFNTQPANCYR